jgi:hypothetical protein
VSAQTERPTRAAWIAFLAILVVAVWLRAADLGAFRNGPDDGSYLHSARIHTLERGLDVWNWPAQDVAWLRELFANYADEINTYQHSYLHQWLTRCLWRGGLGAIEALRWSSVLTSLLGVWFAWLLARRVFPGQVAVALSGAALVALHPLLVFYGRTGWGQAGFTAFYLGFLAVAWRLVGDPRPLSRRCAAWSGVALAATSCLAWGWQENVAPWIVASSVVVLALRVAAPLPEDGSLWARLCDRRMLAYVLGCVPVGAATLALYLWSPFAQKYWFDPAGRAQLPWLELKQRTLADVWGEQRAAELVGWLVLGLALFGSVALWRESRRACVWLVGTALLGCLVLLTLFGDAFLLRIYLPAVALTCLLAARGAMALPGLALRRATAVAVLGWAFVASYSTLFGAMEGTFFLRTVYQRASEQPKDQRHCDTELYQRLASAHQAGERIGVAFDKVPIYKLLDLGLRAEEIAPSRDMPRTAAPQWIVGIVPLMQQRGCLLADGGPYELVLTDTVGRHGLYRLAPAR